VTEESAAPRHWSFRGMWRRWQGGVWQRPDFRALWAAQTVSVFGTLISRTAIPFAAIIDLDASPIDLAILGACEMAPAFLLGLFAGAWVDRLPRKPIMIAADVGRALLLFLVPLLALLDSLSMGLLYVVAIGISVLSVFFDVAYRSILPAILPADELLEGNSRLSASASVAEAGSFSLGGWLVQLFTAPGAVLIDALSFLWSASWLRRMEIDERVKTVEEREPILDEVRDGLHLVWRNRTLRSLAGYSLSFDLAFNMFGAVFLLFVVDTLGFQPGVLGVIFAMGGVASVAGAALAGRITAALGFRQTIILMTVVMAIGQGGVVLATGVTAFAVLLLVVQQFLVDAPYTIVDVNAATIRQLSASEQWQGRINATFRVIAFGGSLVGTLLGGVIGEWIGLRPVLALSALFIGLGALWARGIENPPPDAVTLEAS
jgi:Na+/melibiose symporter-like transporter